MRGRYRERRRERCGKDIDKIDGIKYIEQADENEKTMADTNIDMGN